MRISNDAQAIIVKKKGSSFIFLVIKRFDKEKNEDHYRLVKGGIEKDENAKQAIIREISEEVGISDVKKIEFLSRYKYVGGDIQHKVDVFIVYTNQGDNIKIDSAEEGGFTIKNAVWMTGEEAIKKLNFKEEKDLIAAALAKLNP